MNSFSIGFGNDAQIFVSVRNEAPITNATVRLRLRANGMYENFFDPFRFEVRTSKHHIQCEIRRRFHMVLLLYHVLLIASCDS